MKSRGTAANLLSLLLVKAFVPLVSEGVEKILVGLECRSDSTRML